MHSGERLVVEPVRPLAGAGGRDLEPRPRAPGDGRRAPRGAASSWPISELVLGITVPQKEAFYGAPTLAARLGLGHIERADAGAGLRDLGRVHPLGGGEPAGRAATARGSWSRPTGRATGRISSIRPRLRPARRPDSENWVLDNFGRDPVTGRAMLATAEQVAAEGKIEKAELDDLAVRRYEQYLDALADDRAFQREWMVPIAAGSRRKPVEIDEDWGVRPIVREELEALSPVEEGGVVSYGTQTHPADGCAGHGRDERRDGRRARDRRARRAAPLDRVRPGRARDDAEGAGARGPGGARRRRDRDRPTWP